MLAVPRILSHLTQSWGMLARWGWWRRGTSGAVAHGVLSPTLAGCAARFKFRLIQVLVHCRTSCYLFALTQTHAPLAVCQGLFLSSQNSANSAKGATTPQ